MKYGIIITALLTGLVVAVWDIHAPPPGEHVQTILQDAPDFSFQTIEGKTYKLSDFKGKSVLINIWATWCAPCIAEMPDLLKLAKREDLVFIALSVDERVSDIKPFFKKLGADYDHALIAWDEGKEISRGIYGVTLYPESFIITPKGKIKRRIEGVIDWLGPEGAALFD